MFTAEFQWTHVPWCEWRYWLLFLEYYFHFFAYSVNVGLWIVLAFSPKFQLSGGLYHL